MIVAERTWKPTIKRLGEARGRTFSEAANGGVTGYDPSKLEVPVCIIREGPGNLHDRHWYTREAIQTGPTVFEGKPAFANHPSRIDEQSQPERRIEDILGYYRDVHVEEGADGRAMLCGTLSLLPPESDLLKHTHALLRKAGAYAESYPGSVLAGISINADGEDATAEINGEKWNAVTKFTSAMSADLVTFPAAGGRLLGMLEAAREAVASGRKREATAMIGKAAKDLRASYEKMRAAKSTEDRAAAEAEVGSIMAAMEYLIPPDEEKPAEPKPAEASAPAEPKPQAEAGAAESDAEAGKTAEALEVRAGTLREAAKAIEKSAPELAKAVETIAGSMDAKVIDFRKLRAANADLKAQIAHRESIDRARKILAESKLSEAVISERELWGKSEPEQRAIVESRAKIVAYVESAVAGKAKGSTIEGADPRLSPSATPNDDGSLVARMRESGIPIAAKK